MTEGVWCALSPEEKTKRRDITGMKCRTSANCGTPMLSNVGVATWTGDRLGYHCRLVRGALSNLEIVEHPCVLTKL